MKNKKILVVIIVLFIALFASATFLYDYLGERYQPDALVTEQQSGAEENAENDTEETDADSGQEAQKNPAPDFVVTDKDGNEVRLSDFIGKPVVLNFWASWCGPCKSEMPDFEVAYGKYQEQIHFLMVNLTDGSQETVESASSYISEEGYSFPVYYDTKSEAALTYQVYSVPTSYFIDAEGNLIAMAQGMINSEQLQQGIDMILEDDGE